MKFQIQPVTGEMWEKYREIRLHMLAEDPEAFVSSLRHEPVFGPRIERTSRFLSGAYRWCRIPGSSDTSSTMSLSRARVSRRESRMPASAALGCTVWASTNHDEIDRMYAK